MSSVYDVSVQIAVPGWVFSTDVTQSNWCDRLDAVGVKSPPVAASIPVNEGANPQVFKSEKVIWHWRAIIILALRDPTAQKTLTWSRRSMPRGVHAAVDHIRGQEVELRVGWSAWPWRIFHARTRTHISCKGRFSRISYPHPSPSSSLTTWKTTIHVSFSLTPMLPMTLLRCSSSSWSPAVVSLLWRNPALGRMRVWHEAQLYHGPQLLSQEQ